jgi:hypothetical protein
MRRRRSPDRTGAARCAPLRPARWQGGKAAAQTQRQRLLGFARHRRASRSYQSGLSLVLATTSSASPSACGTTRGGAGRQGRRPVRLACQRQCGAHQRRPGTQDARRGRLEIEGPADVVPGVGERRARSEGHRRRRAGAVVARPPAWKRPLLARVRAISKRHDLKRWHEESACGPRREGGRSSASNGIGQRHARVRAARAGHSNRRYRPCPTLCDGSGWTLRACLGQ